MRDARWMRLDAAAAYLSISAMTFRRRVKAGVLPPPLSVLGMQRWDREALDAAMLGGTMPRSGDEIADAVAARIRGEGRSQAPRGRHDARVPLHARAGAARTP